MTASFDVLTFDVCPSETTILVPRRTASVNGGRSHVRSTTDMHVERRTPNAEGRT